MLTRVQEQAVNRNNSDSLTNVLLPTADGGWRDIYRSGWMPAGFNQQWGGSQWGAEMVDGATGNTFKFDVATGQVQDDVQILFGEQAATYYRSEGFKTSESFTIDAIWLKLYKVGNPTGNITVRIYSDNGSGSPNAVLGSAVTLSCRILTTNANGEWYRISGLSCALTANTQYHIVTTISGVDASNYASHRGTSSKKYPFGFLNSGTSTPAWTPAATYSTCFLLESPIANSLLQSSGQFDGKLVGATSTQPSQLKALCQPLANFFDGKQFTFLERGNWPVSSTIADFVYGLDHDRIRVFTDASGFANVTLWRQDRTSYTVTGTTSVTTGFHDVAIKARTYGDGADILELWVDGVVQGNTLTAQTFTMDGQMRELGTAWIGGGFPTAPTWTQDMQMTSLPSAQGWTWTVAGAVTEATAMSIQNNKLFQNKNAYGATDTGYYNKAAAGLSNATGWIVETKVKQTAGTNTPIVAANGGGLSLIVSDGTKAVAVYIQEYFLSTTSGASAVDFTVQGDFSSKENVFKLTGKGSDYYLYMNGKLIVDGTGKLLGATASNTIAFGDGNAVSGENSGGVWSYVKYYTGGNIFSTSTNAGVTQEVAFWSGNKTVNLPALWNAGTPMGLKRYLNLNKNYVTIVEKNYIQKGIASNPTTTSTTSVLVPDLELFCIGGIISSFYNLSVSQNTGSNTIFSAVTLDGLAESNPGISTPTVANTSNTVTASSSKDILYLGMHKVEVKWYVNATTGTASGPWRAMVVKASS